MIELVRPADRQAYRELVYQIVRAIPAGRAMTYGSIAALIPAPEGTDWVGYQRIRARWVGYAIGDCPADVPWHRVVNARGRISPRFGLGPELQRELLTQEGLSLDRSGKLDLTTLQWEPQPAWLLEHGLLQTPS